MYIYIYIYIYICYKLYTLCRNCQFHGPRHLAPLPSPPSRVEWANLAAIAYGIPS